MAETIFTFTPQEIHDFMVKKYPHMYDGNDDEWCTMRERELSILAQHPDGQLLIEAQYEKDKRITAEYIQDCFGKSKVGKQIIHALTTKIELKPLYPLTTIK